MHGRKLVANVNKYIYIRGAITGQDWVKFFCFSTEKHCKIKLLIILNK